MKFRNVPSIITLLAAFVSCMVMIYRQYTLFEFLIVLVTVIVVFFVIGVFLRFVLNVVFKEPEKKEGEDEDDGTVTENGDEEQDTKDKEDKDKNKKK